MTGFSKFLHILKMIIGAILLFLAVALLSGWLIIKFYIIPRYNKSVTESPGIRREMTDKDILGFAKYFADKQFLDNIKNFDRAAAKDVLNVMTELETEEASEETPNQGNTPAADDPEIWDDELTAPIKNIITSYHPEPAVVPPAPAPEEIVKNIDIPDSRQSAYERIMAAADPDEISKGMEIISKVDIAKVNKLQSEGKTAELKEYIKSTLTQSEISTSLALYNKYKHLL